MVIDTCFFSLATHKSRAAEGEEKNVPLIEILLPCQTTKFSVRFFSYFKLEKSPELFLWTHNNVRIFCWEKKGCDWWFLFEAIWKRFFSLRRIAELCRLRCDCQRNAGLWRKENRFFRFPWMQFQESEALGYKLACLVQDRVWFWPNLLVMDRQRISVKGTNFEEANRKWARKALSNVESKKFDVMNFRQLPLCLFLWKVVVFWSFLNKFFLGDRFIFAPLLHQRF